MENSNNTAKIPEEQPHKCTIDYGFKADCTLYLEDETLVRKLVEGTWFSSRLLNEAEWYANAEHTLAWIVGTLHLHDPSIHARVGKHVVHKWSGWYGPQTKGAA